MIMSKKPRNIGNEADLVDRLYFAKIAEIEDEDGDWENAQGKRVRLYHQIEKGGYLLLTSFQRDHPEAGPLQSRIAGRRINAAVSDRQHLDQNEVIEWVSENLEGNEKDRVIEEIQTGHKDLKRFWEMIHS